MLNTLPEKLMTIDQLSEHLGVKPGTIYEWVYLKKIPYTKVGALLRFPVDLINKWQAKRTFIPAILKGIAVCMASLLICAPAQAHQINVNKLADAIYLAEGGSKTKHPYGILKKYKTTTPRQACINTIKSNRNAILRCLNITSCR